MGSVPCHGLVLRKIHIPYHFLKSIWESSLLPFIILDEFKFTFHVQLTDILALLRVHVIR